MNSIVTPMQNQTTTVVGKEQSVEVHSFSIEHPRAEVLLNSRLGTHEQLDGINQEDNAGHTDMAQNKDSSSGAVSTVEKNSTIHDLEGYLAGAVATAGGIAAVLGNWASDRERWEGAELAASHARLYGILTKCYEYYLLMKSGATDKATRKQLVNGLDLFIRERGMKMQDKTHDMNKVVKAVFGDDRRRVSAYAMALRVALTAGHEVNAKSDYVPADKLATWISAKGGVEEVRLSSKVGGRTATECAALAKAAVTEDEPLMTIKPDVKTMKFGTDDADKMMLLVVMYRPTGELEIKTVVKNDSVVRAAMAAHYAANKEQFGDGKAVQKTDQSTAVAKALELNAN